MKKIILLSILLIVGCATKSVSSSKPTEYSMGMGIEEFKEKNKGLELVEQKEFVLSQYDIWSVDEKYKNGNIKAISYYQKYTQKIELVKIEIYYESGKIQKEKNYIDGELDGYEKKYYYYENGQIYSVENYKDGKLDGKWTIYHENGQIKEDGNYKYGKRDGKWTTYNRDGSFREVEEYKDEYEYSWQRKQKIDD